jgi:small subunit ribosomal protein S17
VTKTAAAPTPAAEDLDRGNRKSLEGVVVSDKMNKTRTVRVSRSVRHPFYEKIMKKSKKFHAHDENNETREGDIVEITSTRPLSKLKRWRIVRVVKAAPKGLAEANAK